MVIAKRKGRHRGKPFYRGLREPLLIGWYAKVPCLFLAQLRLAAAEHGITCSSLVRQAVSEWLGRRGYPPVTPAGWYRLHRRPTRGRPEP
jgi:hypothetical protein